MITNCEHCHKKILKPRKNKRFCNSTCRANHFHQEKGRNTILKEALKEISTFTPEFFERLAENAGIDWKTQGRLCTHEELDWMSEEEYRFYLKLNNVT